MKSVNINPTAVMKRSFPLETCSFKPFHEPEKLPEVFRGEFPPPCIENPAKTLGKLSVDNKAQISFPSIKNEGRSTEFPLSSPGLQPRQLAQGTAHRTWRKWLVVN